MSDTDRFSISSTADTNEWIMKPIIDHDSVLPMLTYVDVVHRFAAKSVAITIYIVRAWLRWIAGAGPNDPNRIDGSVHTQSWWIIDAHARLCPAVGEKVGVGRIRLSDGIRRNRTVLEP